MNSTGSSSEPEHAPDAAAGRPEDRSAPSDATWIEDHADAVYAYARRRLNAPDAEDVTQQAFEALFRAHQTGRAPDNPGAYLLGVARRQIADRHRTTARRGPVSSLPDGWEGLTLEPLPADALASSELRDLVHVALGFLSAVDRTALLAYYREGVSVAEIGARLGATEKAAEMRLRRARTAFEKHFEAVGRDWTGDAGSRSGDAAVSHREAQP